MDNNTLRHKVCVMKAMHIINYYEVADKIGISRKGFYNWLAGYYNLGEKRQKILAQTLENIMNQKG